MKTILAALAVVGVLAFAGCLGSPNFSSRTAPEKASLHGNANTPSELKQAAMDKVKDLMQGVPCEATVDAGTSKNLKFLGNISMERPVGTESLDTHGDIMIAATGGLGMAIMNISDPLAPVVYGYYDGHKGYGDVKISPDNMTAIGGTGDDIDLVDIRNPFEPALVGSFKLSSVGHPNEGTLNAHMLYTASIKGEQWVFIAANNNDGVWITKLVGTPDKRSLQFVTTTLPVEGGPLGPHDMWVTYDQDAKSWLLYSADGYHGWAVFNINDPAKPTLVGGLIRPESGYTHTIQAQKINGKRIVATIAEVGVNILEVYDASNLMAPVLLATWHVQENSNVPQPAAPQHEFNIVAGKLYLGHYANGFFVFDLTKVGTTPVVGTMNLKPVAHYVQGTPTATSLFSNVWSVDVIDGVLYASSMQNGVNIVGYGCNTPGDASLRSTG